MISTFIAWAAASQNLELSPTISLSANTLAVTSTTVGSTNTGTITVTNTGGSPLTISELTVTGTDAANYSVTGCASALAAGATCTLTVTFAPTTAGTKTATLSIAHNATGSPSTVSLSSTAVAPTYAITANTASVNEGDTVQFTVTTTNVADNTVLYWGTITGGVYTTAGDFTDNTTTGTATITGNTGTITRTLANDLTTEGSESLVIIISDSASLTPRRATSDTVVINDTSRAPTYAITANTASVNEGDSVQFTVTTTDVPDNTVLYWNIATGNITASDFSDNTGSGTVTITGNTGTFTRTLALDLLTEGSESFLIQLRTGSNSGTVRVASATVVVSDTSVPTYSISPSTTSVNEGSSVTFTVTTAGVPNGTILYWTTTGTTNSADFSSATSGSVTITGGTGTITRTLVNDLTTEGSESFAIELRTGSTSGTIRATSDTVVVSDTSVPTYSISPSATSVNEGSSVTFTVTTAGVSNGTVLYWTTSQITGTIATSDFSDSALSGTVTITSGTGTISRTLANDLTTEGSESFAIELRTGSTSGTIQATSATVVVSDTSLTTTYAITANTASVNEGSTVQFTVTTTNVADSTVLYWTASQITGTITTSDFSDSALSGTVTITGNTGTISRTLANDLTTEGSESFAIELRTGSTSGTIQATSATVVVTDTSLTPATDSSWANVSMLLHMDGTSGSTTFTDSSVNALTVTANGNAQLSTSTTKYGTASGYFDGTDDYLAATFASGTAISGTENFTIECWYNSGNLSGSQYGRGIISLYNASNHKLLIRATNTSPYVLNLYSAEASGTPFGSSGSNVDGTTITANTWYHVALVRQSGVFTLYLDGVLKWTMSAATSQSISAKDNIYIGRSTDGASPDWVGYIDDLRITKGVARYTSNFAAPSAAFPAGAPAITLSASSLTLSTVAPGDTSTGTVTVTSSGASPLTISSVTLEGTDAADFTISSGCSAAIAANSNCAIAVTFDPVGTGDKYWTNTSLLMNMDGTNGSTTFTDATGLNTFNRIGNTQISTAQSKFGGASAYFDGTGDYLTVPANPAFAFGTDDFTIECWFRKTSGTNNGILSLSGISTYFTTTGSITLTAYQNKIAGYVGATGFGGHAAQTTLIDNQWYHVALVRSSGVAKVYLNGVAEPAFASGASSTLTDTTSFGYTYLLIGGYYATSTLWNGYIDDLRITKGVARYAGNFTLPTGAASSDAFSTTYGTRTANLIIAHDAVSSPSVVALTSNVVAAAPAITLSSDSLSIASTNVGSSNTGTITVTNTGTTSLMLSGLTFTGTDAANYSVSGCSSAVAAGATCTLTVTFTPTTAGSKTATLSIAHNATGSPSTVSLSSTAVAPAISLSSSNLSIASTDVGSSNTGTITVTNTGTAPLTVASLTLTGTDAASYSVSGCSSAVAAGATCTLTVTFTPTSGGSKTATLSIAHNATGSPSTVSLSSTAVATPAISLSSSNLSIASTYIGSSNTGTITVTNTGTAPLAVDSLTFTGTDAASYSVSGCSSAVAAGATCTLTVTFAPTTTGSKTATLSIAHNATGSPSTVSLSSTALTPVPAISLSASTLSFSSISLGTTSTSTITVNNTGTADLTISSLSITGANAAEFSVSGCSSAITAGGSCFLAITFAPTAAGSKLASLSIVHNATGSPTIVSLDGTGAAVVAAVDQNFSATSLLMHMDGTNGSTAFIDATGKNAITRVGDTQISTAQSKFGGASAYFDGTGDRLTLPANTAFAFGTGDFTIECWFNVSSLATNKGIFQLSNSSNYLTSNTASILMSTYQGKITINLMAISAQTSLTVTDGSWYHVALVRSAGVAKIYINGQLRTEVGTAGAITDSNNYSYTYLGIGAYGSSTQTWNGYIDEFRITKGIARYTGNFTLPTTAFYNTASTTNLDPYFNQVSTLLHMDGTSGSTAFTDSSVNTLAVTANGNAQLNTATTKYGTASGYFDGTDDYLAATFASGTAISGTGDFTVECWINPGNLSGSQYGRGIISLYNASGHKLLIRVSTTSPYLLNVYSAEASGTPLGTSGTNVTGSTITANTWYHVALVRQSGVFNLYLDGVLLFTNNSNTALSLSTKDKIYVGRSPDGASPDWVGYIDDVRITNSVARYAANFTPPTQAYPNSASLTSPVAGTTSVYFDGTGDYLSAPANALFNFGTADFTVEAWIWPMVRPASGYQMVYDQWTGLAGSYVTGQWQIGLNTTGVVYVFVATNSSTSTSPLVSTSTIPLNTWTHIAVARTGTTVNLFINGKLDKTATSAASFGVSTAPAVVGRQQSTATNQWNGYVADLRVTKGQSVYTAAFNPPASALTASANTSLLVSASGATIVDATGNSTITAFGDAKLTSQLPGQS